MYLEGGGIGAASDNYELMFTSMPVVNLNLGKIATPRAVKYFERLLKAAKELNI